jgi:ribosomal protein S18 acetylase RimI-like enzyme
VRATTELQRIGEFLADIEDEAAQRTEPVAGGVALFDDRVPKVWMANHLRIDAATDLTAAELAAETERVQSSAGLKHRRITLRDAVAGRQLAPSFRALGWDVERLAVMVKRRPLQPPVPTHEVQELSDGSWRMFRKQMLEDEDVEAETIRQVDEALQTLFRAVDVRTFGGSVDGVIASCCDLFCDGRTAQVEAVATLRQYRNRGLARAVIWRGIEEATASGHDLIFMVADADDWPRGLYKKLGFDEIGYFYEFLKDASAASPARRLSPRPPRPAPFERDGRGS